MEGVCGIISFGGLTADAEHGVIKMAQRLSDGEELKISRLCGSNWALASAGWKDSHWYGIDFQIENEQIVAIGIADVQNLEDLARKYNLPDHNLADLVLACYQSNGAKWPLEIQGTFSVIMFEKQKQELCAVVDHLGIRPLYWHKEGDTYYIGSRLSTIYSLCRNLEVNQDGILAFMHHSMIPSPMTIFKDVEKIEPGTSLIARQNEMRMWSYWDITSDPKLKLHSTEIAQQIHDQVRVAIKDMRNGPSANNQFGCFLSGGTDSSSICGLLSQMQQEPVSAYSIGFPENGYDEMYYARIAAEAFKLDHHEYYVRPEDVIEALPKIVGVYDEPFGNASAIPTYFCAKTAFLDGKHYMLAGDGGDEVFAGNERYAMQQVFRNYFKVPAWIRNALIEPILLGRLERAPMDVFRKAGSYVRRAKLPEVARIHSYKYVTDEETFTGKFLRYCSFRGVETIPNKHFDRLDDANLLDRHLYMDMKLTITDNDLRKVSRMCDLAHMRVRYPLLDRNVVDLGFSIPTHLKLKGVSQLRHIFKQAFTNVLPGEILTKKKHGFGLPISNWLRDNPSIRQWAHELLFDGRHLSRGVFNQDFVKKLWDYQLEDTTPYYGTYVWNMIMLEAWYRVHYEGSGL